jgi:hypothetical protein
VTETPSMAATSLVPRYPLPRLTCADLGRAMESSL